MATTLMADLPKMPIISPDDVAKRMTVPAAASLWKSISLIPGEIAKLEDSKS